MDRSETADGAEAGSPDAAADREPQAPGGSDSTPKENEAGAGSAGGPTLDDPNSDC